MTGTNELQFIAAEVMQYLGCQHVVEREREPALGAIGEINRRLDNVREIAGCVGL